MLSKFLDPNALFVVIDDPHHRTAPSIPVPRPTTAQPAPAAGRDWFVVTDDNDQPRRGQRPKPAADPQAPPPANLILSKNVDSDSMSNINFS